MFTNHYYILSFLIKIFYTIFLGVCTSISAKDTVYALIAVDTLSNLVSSVEKDRVNMVALLKELTLHGVSVKLSELSGAHMTMHNIQTWITKLPKNSKDAILFYYSGHGTRSKKTKSPWPLLALQSGKELIASNAIKEALIRKKPRLTVLLTDCCNATYIPKGSIPSQSDINGIKEIAASLKQVFIKSKGVVAITASWPGQSAIGFVGYGGLMTNLFLCSILENTTHPISWHKVAKYIEKKGEKYSQVPYYEINK